MLWEAFTLALSLLICVWSCAIFILTGQREFLRDNEGEITCDIHFAWDFSIIPHSGVNRLTSLSSTA